MRRMRDHGARSRPKGGEDEVRIELCRAPRRLEVPCLDTTLSTRADLRAHWRADRAQHDQRSLSACRTEARAAAHSALRRNQKGLSRPRRRNVLQDDAAE